MPNLLSRRQALRFAALAAVPLFLPSFLTGGEPAVPANSRITLGVIGAGNQGGSDLGAFLNDPRVQVVAVCDPDRGRMLAAKKRIDERNQNTDCTMHGDFREIIGRADIDAVLIATPDHWHALPAILAARAGKHIYLQKPIALTIPEGRAIADAVAGSGVVCLIGAQQRSGGEFIRAYELVRNGFLGEITDVQVGLPGGAGNALTLAPQQVPADFDYEMWLGPAPAAPYYKERCHYNFRWILDYSGGHLTDWISHHYDCAAWSLGLNHTGPVRITDAAATFASGPLYNTPDDYRFTTVYATGQRISVSNKNKGGIEFTGSAGSLHVNRGSLTTSDPRLLHATIPGNGIVVPNKSNHYRHFIDCIVDRLPPRTPADELHITASVAHLANLAFRTGRSELRWDPLAERLIDAPDAERLLHRAYRGPWQLPV